MDTKVLTLGKLVSPRASAVHAAGRDQGELNFPLVFHSFDLESQQYSLKMNDGSTSIDPGGQVSLMTYLDEKRMLSGLVGVPGKPIPIEAEFNSFSNDQTSIVCSEPAEGTPPFFIHNFQTGEQISIPILPESDRGAGMGVLGFAAAVLLFELANSFWMLFLARTLSGILSSATMPTAMAYTGDQAPEKERSAGMGKLGAAMGVDRSGIERLLLGLCRGTSGHGDGAEQCRHQSGTCHRSIVGGLSL